MTPPPRPPSPGLSSLPPSLSPPPSQVREVDAELEAYHRSNTELDALIGRLRESLNELQVSGGEGGAPGRESLTPSVVSPPQIEAAAMRSESLQKEAAARNFTAALHEVVHTAKEPTGACDGGGR